MLVKNSRSPIAVLCTVVLLCLAEPSFAQWPLPQNQDGRPTLSPLLEEVTPAIVNISVTGKASRQRNPLFDDPLFRRFFDFPDQRRMLPQQSVGSGVIVAAKEGFVLTNHHVVADAEEIVVTLLDRRQFNAELVGSDAGTDIALLQIEGRDFTAIEIGDSTTLKVGDFVIAIGNPFGLGQTVTSGIVSALGRSGLNVDGYEDFIQTDASINPGNSGGALVDLDGRLIGINTAIIAPAGGNVGIGFAVPVHMAQAVMDQLLEYGEVRRGRLGIIIQDVTPDLADALDLATAEGAVVTQVEPGSAAETAGIKAGDVIVAVDDQAVTGSSSLRNLIGLMRVGKEVEISLLRDGRSRTVDARIGKPRASSLAGDSMIPRLSGAVFRSLDPSHPEHGNVKGVLVADVEQGSPAWRNGLRSGDIVLAVNRRAVDSVDALSAALGAAGSTIALNILRDNTRMFLVVQ